MSLSVATVQLLVWIASRPRSHSETADAWKLSGERVATYEAALADGLIEMVADRVVLTTAGAACLTSSIWRAACGRQV